MITGTLSCSSRPGGGASQMSYDAAQLLQKASDRKVAHVSGESDAACEHPVVEPACSQRERVVSYR